MLRSPLRIVAAVLMLGILASAGYGLASLASGTPGQLATLPCGNAPSTAGDTNPINGESFIQDNLWTSAGEQFAVWVGPGGRPFVARHRQCSSTWQRVNLGDLPGNPLLAPTGHDEHDVYVIAVDSLGYIHIAGNMHGVPLRYIRSTYPWEITTWETGQMPGPTTSVTYPQFVELPDGTLQFWYREGISGKSRELMDALPAGATTWRSMGTIFDGRSTHEGAYLNHIAVDSKTGMIDTHVRVAQRTPDPSTTNDVGYAQSPDGGRTWETATGKPIALPITHDAEDTVLKTAPSGSGLENNGGLTVDAQGHPHGVVVFGGPGGPDVGAALVRRPEMAPAAPLVTFWTGVQRWRPHLTAKCGCWALSTTRSRRSTSRREARSSGLPWLGFRPDGRPFLTPGNWPFRAGCRC